MPFGFARYGLEGNPFRIELKPLAKADHEEMVVQVDGFRKLPEIDDYLKQMASREQPLFFLVTGRNGSGRTCVADYILARYRYHRQIPPERFIVPDREVSNHDVYETFQNWMIYLHNELDALRPLVKLEENLLDRIQRTQPATMEAVFQGLMTSIHKVSKAGDAGFGCCLEDVLTYNFINSAFKIFQKTQTICVFTAKDYEEWQKQVIEPFHQRALGHVIELSPLVGQHVQILVEQRWQQIANSPSPFDAEGLADAFDKKPRTIGRALKIVSKILAIKVPLHIEGGIWPHDETLRLSHKELENFVRTLDED